MSPTRQLLKILKSILFVICFSVMIFMSHVLEATAATYYVCSNGCDYSTIQAAANNVSPGDNVIVKNGTYRAGGNQVVSFTESGNANDWITFKSENKWGAVIDAADTNTNAIYFGGNVGYLRIEGFDIKGATYSNVHMNMRGIHDVVLYNNLIHDNANYCAGDQSGHNGIRVKYDATNIVIDSNKIYNIGRPSCGRDLKHDHGIYTSAPVTIVNNIFYNNLSGYDIKINGGKDQEIVNNTFADAHTQRIGHIVVGVENPATNVLIQNNISYNPKEAMIHNWRPSVNNIIVKNNLIYGVSKIADVMGGIITGGNIIGEDPRFLDTTNRDYHLLSHSPAISAGIAPNSPSYDHDDNSRPSGSDWDIGAYEYGGMPTSTKTCTSFTYSPWSDCQSNNIQTRSVTSSSPTGCSGGSPDLTQSCSYTGGEPPEGSGAFVTTNKTSYKPGDIITITVDGGNSNVGEWVALYVASNPDSSYSFEGNWQSLNGTKTNPETPVPYPVALTFTAPQTEGTYNIRYFATDGYGARLAVSEKFTVTNQPSLQGDINGDGNVDVLDVQACVNHILGIQDAGSSADVNGDGNVNVLDVQTIVNTILGGA